MRYNLSYSQRDNKLVNRYVSDPKVTESVKITNKIFDDLEAMYKASGGKEISVELYDVFSETWKMKYTSDGLSSVSTKEFNGFI